MNVITDSKASSNPVKKQSETLSVQAQIVKDPVVRIKTGKPGRPKGSGSNANKKQASIKDKDSQSGIDELKS